MRWLLLSDIHFRRHDLERVCRTGEWIVEEAARHGVSRAVVCGDLLTTRTMQPTHVLSACYRFISRLSDAVPRVHILLGNHDLAYRRDYQTTALDALNFRRLAPHVSLHSRVARHDWDGRRVLLLPFREDQQELTNAVAALPPHDAANTVAFAHLAINKAIVQRHVVGAKNSVTYHGLTGPDHFATLARTFTGHFHSHQTITQKKPFPASNHPLTSKDDLQGSITYLGSPLQLSWADLADEQRGAVLFDPDTLDHQLLVNPHAVGYVTADLHHVLDDQIDTTAVAGKHVMLLGKLSVSNYVTARDKLLALGACNVRNWSPLGPVMRADSPSQPSFGRLGASVPASDAGVHRASDEFVVPEDHSVTDYPEQASDFVPSDSGHGVEALPEKQIDLPGEAREYLELLDLDESLALRRHELLRIGQQMMQVSHDIANRDDEITVTYQDFLHDKGSSRSVGADDTKTPIDVADRSTHIFVGEPRRLTITNFLGVQDTLTIDFQKDLARGLIFLFGDNGSGKSTLVEALTWCQFGRCIRGGLAVNDVVNDKAGKDCCVTLEFANGYSITRYRKHKEHKNRVVVSLHGEPQTQLEHPDARTTQAAVDELLGTDYETYARTVVLSHETAAGFLSSTPGQRRDLIEELLGLSVLDRCAQVSRLLLRSVDSDTGELKGKLEGLVRTVEYCEQRIRDLNRTRQRLEKEAEEDAESLEAVIQESDFASEDAQNATLSMNSLRDGISTLQKQIVLERGLADQLKISHAWMKKKKEQRQHEQQKHMESMSWLGHLHQRLGERLVTISENNKSYAHHKTGARDHLQAIKTNTLCWVLSTTVRGLAIIGKTFLDKNFGEQPPSAQTKEEEEAEMVMIKNLDQDIEQSTVRLNKLEQEKELALEQVFTIDKQRAEAERVQKAREALSLEVANKQRDATTYTQLIQEERLSLRSVHAEHGMLAAKLEKLAADRELFAFWSSALAKRSPRTTSSSAAAATTASANFREHMLSKSLSVLNSLLAQGLAILYNDTRHAHEAKGMLRALFDSLDNDVEPSEHTTTSGKDAGKKTKKQPRKRRTKKGKQSDQVDKDGGIAEEKSDSNNDDNSPENNSILEPTLAVHPSLSYGKRSSGERKRVDLALFFALLQLVRARSARHRARYILVDEVLDNLDGMGQTAVARWCGAMTTTTMTPGAAGGGGVYGGGVVDWVVVITHNRALVDREGRQSGGGEEGHGVNKSNNDDVDDANGIVFNNALVVEARMGRDGTELFVDGRRIGK